MNRALSAVLALLTFVLADVPRAMAADMLSGRAALPEHVATPAAAVLEVALVDLSVLDEDDHLLGSVRIDSPGAAPLHFSVPYDRHRILAAHRYIVRAALRVNGTLAYAGEQTLASRTLTRTPVRILLTPVDPPAGTASAAHGGPVLAGTDWRVVEIDGQAVSATPAGVEPSLAFAEPDRVTGHAGCNRLIGRYEVAGSALHTDSIVTTRMACPPAVMAIETHLLGALAAAASVQASGDALEIRDGAGLLRLRLNSVHSH